MIFRLVFEAGRPWAEEKLRFTCKEDIIIAMNFPIVSILRHSSTPGFPCGASDQESTCNAGKRFGFDPWTRKIPWRRAWQPTPDSCLENPMDRGALWAMVHRVTKSWI